MFKYVDDEQQLWTQVGYIRSGIYQQLNYVLAMGNLFESLHELYTNDSYFGASRMSILPSKQESFVPAVTPQILPELESHRTSLNVDFGFQGGRIVEFGLQDRVLLSLDSRTT